MKPSGMYKVPFRNCYSPSIGGWLRYAAWCHIVLRVWPHARDMGTEYA